MINAKFKEIRKKIRLSKEARLVLFQIGLFLLGFGLSSVRFLFGTYPFGIALLGASKRYAPFVFAGAMLSAILIMEEGALYAVAFIGLLGLRICASFIKKNEFKRTELGKSKGKSIAELLFCEGVELRVTVAAFVALGIGIYNVIANGYVYYDVFVLIFNTVLVSIVTFCLSGLFEQGSRRARYLGVGALGFCLVYALSGFDIGGIDMVIALSYGAVLYVSRVFGGIGGGALGVLLGVAQGGILSGVFGIGGVVSGFLWTVSPYLAIMCSFILSMGYAISIMGYEAIIFLIPELLGASLVMYPLLKFELLPKPATLGKAEDSKMENYRLEERAVRLKNRLSRLSTAYGEVARTLRDVSKKTKAPDKGGYQCIALEECEEHCYACPKHSICWERDIGTTQININKMGDALFAKGETKKEDVEEKFLHRCPNIEKIMDSLNAKNRQILTQSVKNDKLDACAQDYDYTAKVIDAMYKTDKEERVDKVLTEKAIRTCAACGLVCQRVQVEGTGRKRIVATGVDVQRSKCTLAILRQELEKSLCLGLTEGETLEDEELVTIILESESNLKIETSCISRPLERDGENGDSYSCFESDSVQYIIICDGMGSGGDAHLTSQLSVELMEKMLSATREKEATLSMLNNLIRAKNTECSTTVDLFELDLVTGNGKMVKSGACPSFIKRGDKVFMLQSRTAPVGIMKSLDAEEHSFTLSKGDICVMASDGILPSKQDSRWLMQYLTEFKGDSPEALSKGIMREAKKRGIKDDCTLICSVIN